MVFWGDTMVLEQHWGPRSAWCSDVHSSVLIVLGFCFVLLVLGVLLKSLTM